LSDEFFQWQLLMDIRFWVLDYLKKKKLKKTFVLIKTSCRKIFGRGSEWIIFSFETSFGEPMRRIFFFCLEGFN